MSEPLKSLLPSDMMLRPWRVVVVGAGGTGSAVLPSLARLHHAMVELGHPGGIDCTVYDDDVVSPTNVGRQGFYPNDIGAPKATLIVNRLNLLMGTQWEAVVGRVTSTVRFRPTDIVIGCVDTRAARKAILGASERCYASYYLDCGNDTDRGQVIVGHGPKAKLKKGELKLPHVGNLFPELIDSALDAKDETPSCSMADALRKQSLVINQSIAVQAFNVLWMMFRNGSIPFSGVFVNLATGRTNPVPVDPAAWARFGYVSATKGAAKKRKSKIVEAA